MSNEENKTHAEIRLLLMDFFNQDLNKVNTWMFTKNPLLGEQTPETLLRRNPKKLLQWIKDQREGNIP